MSNYGMTADFKCRSRQGITRKRVTMQFAMHKNKGPLRAPIKKFNHYQHLPLVTKDKYGWHRSNTSGFFFECNRILGIMSHLGMFFPF